MTIYGYARVSTQDQNPALQTQALEAEGAQLIFYDKASGRDASRPELQKLIRVLKEGDVVLIWKLDRLARSISDMYRILAAIEENGAGLRSLTEKMIDTTNRKDPMAKLLFGILAVFGEFERAIISERVRSGVAIAKAAGKLKGGGRPKALGCVDTVNFMKDVKIGLITIADICRKYRISRTTYYKIIAREADAEKDLLNDAICQINTEKLESLGY